MAIAIDHIVFEFLSASGTDLFTLCNTRIRPFVSWKTDDNSEAFVVYNVAGGDLNIDTAVANPRIEFLCYGGSQDWSDAWAVEEALRDRLQVATQQAVASGVLMFAQQSISGQMQKDENEWPFIVTAYEMWMRAT